MDEKEKLTKELEAIQLEITKQNRKHDDALSSYNQTVKLIEEAISKLDILNKDVEDKEKHVESINANVASIEENLKTTISESNKQKEEIKDELNGLVVKLGTLNKLVADQEEKYNSDMAKNQAEFAELENTHNIRINELTEKEKTLTTTTEVAEAKNIELTSKKEALEKEIGELEVKKTENVAIIETQDAQISSFDSKVEVLDQNVADLNNQITDLNIILGQKNDLITTKNTEIETLNASIDTLTVENKAEEDKRSGFLKEKNLLANERLALTQREAFIRAKYELIGEPYN